MKTCRHEPMTYFDIWQPKWHTESGGREAWLKVDKVKHAKTHYLKVVFTKTKAEDYQGEWVISKAKAMTYPRGTNGAIPIYRVPFEDLEPLEIVSGCIHEF